MRNKPIRALSTLLAVLMIVLAVPAMPIFGAAKDINSITFKKPTNNELVQLVFYDSKKPEDPIDFFNTMEEGAVSGDVTFGAVTYTATSVGEDLKLGKKDDASFDSFDLIVESAVPGLEIKVSDNNGNSKVYKDDLTWTKDADFYRATLNFKFGARYPLASLKGDLTVEFSTPAPTHTVNWTPSGEYQLFEYNKPFDIHNAKGLTPGMKVEEKGDSASFTFVLHVDEPTKTPVVKYSIGSGRQQVVNNESLEVEEAGYYKYTISSITDDLNILINLYNALTVSWNTGTGYSVAGSHSIAYNSNADYKITVTPEPGYDIKSVTAGGIDFPNGISLSSGDNNVYTLAAPQNGFRNSVTISIIAEKKAFTVNSTTATNDAFETTFSDQTREYGDSYTFTVDPKEGYNAPEVKVYKGGADVTTDQLKKSGNTYTIENITDDLTVVFAAGSQIEYTVTYPSSPLGYKLTVKKNGSESITSGTRVPHGTSLTIEVEVLDEYSKSIDGLTLTINNTRQDTQKDDSGKFTFNCTVKGDVSINVTGLSINTYTIDVPTKNVGYTVTGAPTGKVQHGESVTFTIELSDGYKLSKTSDLESLFTINGDTPELTYNEGANTVTCKIDKITKDFSLTINEGSIEIIKFEVTVYKADGTKGKGYTVTLDGDVEKNDSVEIEYNQNANFTVKPDLGYVISAVSVKEKKADGSEGSSVPADVVSKEAGTYVIKNVMSNYDIVVECTPITVTINYHFDVVKFSNLWNILDAREEIKQYTFGDMNEPSKDNFKTEDIDGKPTLTIKLYTEADTEGLVFDGWTKDISHQGVKYDKLTLTDSTTVNQTFDFYGAYKVRDDVITSGDQQTGDDTPPFLAVDEQKKNHDATVKGDRGVFSSSLGLKLYLEDKVTGQKFEQAFKDPKDDKTLVLACGMLYSQNVIVPGQYIQAIKDLYNGDAKSEFLNGGSSQQPESVYCYYYDADDFGTFDLGESLTVRVSKPKNESNRYGVMWFLVKIGGEEFLFFGQCEKCDFKAANQ